MLFRSGDGGMVVTHDADRAAKLAVLRNHGSKPKYYHKIIGGNFRLDTLQAAVIVKKLRHLDKWSEQRQANADRYRSLFSDSGLVKAGVVGLPETVMSRHIYNQFVIRVERRDELREHLAKQGVGSEVYYPVPMHLQECFAYLGHREGEFPESEKAAQQTVALPIYPELKDEQAQYVVEQIAAFYA